MPPILLVVVWVLGAVPTQAQEAGSLPLRTVIETIEAETPYRFLYRDALVAGVVVEAVPSSEGGLQALGATLAQQGLALQVDAERYQVLITRSPATSPPTHLRGTVVDAANGQRLPFATLTWRVDGQLQGVTADEVGQFILPLEVVLDRSGPRLVTASYVGYEARTVALLSTALPPRLDVRLAPDARLEQEVVVVGSTGLQTHLDTTWHRLVQPTLFSPFGERSVLRALQPLPAVAVSPAFSEGLNVRGSPADAFQVMLDGIPIYGQSHFFGLFDAFNDEALQAVSLYYDVAPAQYAAPPGGTLSFLTRTGSQTQLSAHVGVSNVAVRGTAEGPWRQGRGSWLLSGRHSTLNALDWLGNDDLVALGLDVDRPTSDVEGVEFESRLLRNGAAEASFYDLHGKLYLESAGGTRLTASGYLGGDDTAYDAERLRPGPGVDGLVWQPVTTASSWGNQAASLEVRHPLEEGLSMRSHLAVTSYDSRYQKDDFLYRAVEREAATGRIIDRQQAIGGFSYTNTLTEWKAAQQVQGVAGRRVGWRAGLDWHHYRIRYAESSALRPSYDETQTAQQVDAFGHLDAHLGLVHLEAGLRSHFFDADGRLRWSPRLRARFFPEAPVSASLGASRNYQYLHRLSLQNTNSTHIWVLSADEAPPSIADQATAGLYARAGTRLTFQAEAYLKWTQHVRQHETNAPAYLIPRQNTVGLPWFSDHTAWARGLELLQRFDGGQVSWTNSYALSRVELRNPALNDNAWFRADWDRLHQVTSHLRLAPDAFWTVDLTWTWASGPPNTLAYRLEGLPPLPNEPDELSAYHRLDLSLAHQRRLGSVDLQVRASLFNVYDQANVWYRDTIEIRPSEQSRRLQSVNVDVYDLGIQPSFDVTLRF
ncbi:MAG: hypothetical protein AAGI71_07505 [Bacteroidota bacterium]